MLIRESTIDDVPGFDRVRQAALPWHTATVQTQRIWFRTQPEGAKTRHVCAEVDGVIVGMSIGGLDPTAGEPGIASVSVTVHPAARGRGVGIGLYERIEDHLRQIGARRVLAHALDEPDVLGWATRRGFRLGATARFLRVDPRVLPPMPPVPPGVSVHSAGEVEPEAFYQVDNEASQDEPGDVDYIGMPFADWQARFWNIIDKNASLLAFVDGEPAAVTMLDVNADSGRAISTGTSTLRRFRGRGLVKLIKSVSLRRAAEAGVTVAYTGNDDTNAAMLAVNRWLGYRDFAGSRSVLKTL